MVKKRNFVFLDHGQKRWQRIKRGVILGFSLFFIVVIFSLISILSIPRFGPKLEERFGKNAQDIIDTLSTQKQDVIEVKGTGPLIDLTEENGQLHLQKTAPEPEKQVVFTFDDGPDPTFTPKILEILKKENVKAVFFVIGEQLTRYPKFAKQILKEGHELGVHTFSHTPEEEHLYNNQQKLSFEIDFPQKIIRAQTGYTTHLLRLPYWGTEDTISLNNLVLTTHALDRSYTVLISTVDSFDWQEIVSQKVINNSVNTEKDIQVILLHDGGGDRSVTVAALPEIIKKYKEAGYHFTTADELIGDQPLMEPATLVEKVEANTALFLYWLNSHLLTLFNPLFKVSLVIITISILITLALSTTHITVRNRNKNGEQFIPSVSILIPAFNEEKTIGRTIKSLLVSSYPNFEIIVINNNSRDNTVGVVKQFTNGKIKLAYEKIQGKFAALNCGIKLAKGDILVVVDADTQVLPSTIFELVQPFRDRKIGSVAGNIKVGNITNLLTTFQSIEYTVGLHLDRRAFDVLGAVPVVPGALGAWRKRAVEKVGGYKEDTITEDADLSIRIQQAGYKIVFVGEAIAYTEAPEKIRDFLRQRLRWTFGILQVLYKHKNLYFRRKYGVLGMIVLPYLGLIQLPILLIAPLVDLSAMIFLLLVSPDPVIFYFIGFLILNLILTAVAFFFARESKIWLLLSLPFARIVYQGIWYYVLYRSVITGLRGQFVPWAKLPHRGNVSLEQIQKPAIVLAPEIARSNQ